MGDDDDLIDEDASSTPSGCREMVILWTEGPFGMTLKEDAGTGNLLISRFTGRGTTPGLTELRPGDTLKQVNNISVDEVDLKTLMQMLKNSPKPVELRFRL